MHSRIKPRLKRNARLAIMLVALFLPNLSSDAMLAHRGPRSAVAAQQAPAAQSSEAQQARPPINQEPLKVRLPRAREATLKNGLRVIALEGYDQFPTFTMQMVILSGGLSDPPDRRGLASFTAALLREGSATRAGRDISEQVESLGAALTSDAGVSSFTTTVSASGLAPNFDRVVAIFADVIRRPAFPADEVEKYKARTISQLQLQRANPRFLAQERFSRAIYGDHPAGLAAAPIDALKRTTREDLARFHAAHYLPNNAILAVVGAAPLKEILPKLERAFGDWRRGETPTTVIPPAPAQPAARIYLLDRPGSVQTALQLGSLGITRTDPDYFALLVMDKIVGGGPEARLFMNLREQKGYTYGAYSSFSSSRFRGVWQANAEVRTAVTEGAMKEFIYELKRIRDEKVDPAELEGAKRALAGSFALSLEQPQTLLQNIITQQLYHLPADYWDAYLRKVAGVSAEDIQRAARKYVDLERLQIVAVGDAAQIREALQKYGPVEIYDAAGKPVKDAGGR